MRGRDPVADREPQTRSLAGLLGREERFEDPRLEVRRYAYAVVRHAELGPFPIPAGLYTDSPRSGGRLAESELRVAQQVENDLSDLARVHPDDRLGVIRREMQIQIYVGLPQTKLGDIQYLLDHGAKGMPLS